MGYEKRLLHTLTVLFVSLILSIPVNVQSQPDPICSINDNVLKINYRNIEYTHLIGYGVRKVSCKSQQIDDQEFVFVRYEATIEAQSTMIVHCLNIFALSKDGDKNVINIAFKDTIKDWLKGDKEPEEDRSIAQLTKVDNEIVLILKSSFDPDDQTLWLRFLYDPIKHRFFVQ